MWCVRAALERDADGREWERSSLAWRDERDSSLTSHVGRVAAAATERLETEARGAARDATGNAAAIAYAYVICMWDLSDAARGGATRPTDRGGSRRGAARAGGYYSGFGWMRCGRGARTHTVRYTAMPKQVRGPTHVRHPVPLGLCSHLCVNGHLCCERRPRRSGRAETCVCLERHQLIPNIQGKNNNDNQTCRCLT